MKRTLTQLNTIKQTQFFIHAKIKLAAFMLFCLCGMLNFNGAWAQGALTRDWTPFPANQKTWFEFNNETFTLPALYYATSIIQQGNQVQYYLDANNTAGIAGTNIGENCDEDYTSRAQDFIKSIEPITEEDGLHYYQGKLVFNVNLNVGEGFFIQSANYTGFDEVYMECIEQLTENVFGENDEVKVFSLQAFANGQPVAGAFDNFSYRLSKSYGFLQFLPFTELLSEPKTSAILTGFQNGDENLVGNKGDQFIPPYEAGDVIYTSKTVDRLQQNLGDRILLEATSYSHDSITTVVTYPDSLTYIFDRIEIKESLNIIPGNSNPVTLVDTIQTFANQNTYVYDQAINPEVYKSIYGYTLGSGLRYIDIVPNSISFNHETASVVRVSQTPYGLTNDGCRSWPNFNKGSIHYHTELGEIYNSLEDDCCISQHWRLMAYQKGNVIYPLSQLKATYQNTDDPVILGTDMTGPGVENGTFYPHLVPNNLLNTPFDITYNAGPWEFKQSVTVSGSTDGSSNNQIFNEYFWLNNFINPNNCNGESISVYNSGANHFVLIQNGDEGKLYFQDGTYYCDETPTYSCLNAYGLNTIAQTWTCGNSTSSTCNTYLGTFFYADCGGVSYYFIELEDGRIFDPYFAVDPGYYPEEGQQIRFDFEIKTDVSTPCNISESPITINCFEPYEPVEESPCDLPFDQGDDCSTQPYLRYHYSAETGGCQSFPYSGCGGNANNYETYSECINACNAVLSCPDGDPLQWDWIQDIINSERVCLFGSIELLEYNDGNIYFKTSPGPWPYQDPIQTDSWCHTSGAPTHTYNCQGMLLCAFEPFHQPVCSMGDLGEIVNSTTLYIRENENENENENDVACDLPFDEGTCGEFNPRYYYNSDAGVCQSFIYTGCGGNANNYETYSECINACNAVVSCPNGDPLQWDWIQEIINQGKPCVAGSIYLQEYEDGNFYVKIYPGDYHPPPPSGAPPASCTPGGPTLTYTCEGQFLCRFEPVHSPTPCNLGDFGNLLNNTLIWEYETEEEQPTNEPACSLPLDVGTCDDFNPRYYFNSDAGVCQSFVYTGCGGNANNYETYADCVNACSLNNNCPNGNPLEWDWMQDIIANSDGCEVEQIDQFEYNGALYFIVGPGNTCGFQDNFFYRYYDCKGNFICHVGLLPIDFPDSCFPDMFDETQNRTTIWTYEFNCTLEDDPLETTWLKELIINGEGCTVYSIRQFVYNELIHFEVAPNPNCVSDFYKDYYDCTGNLICSSSIFNDTCDSDLSIAASLTPDIWSYNSAGCANPLQTNFVQNWLNADCQPESIYSFEFEGETFIYAEPGENCYDSYLDEADLFYNCNADITCNLTSAFLGYYDFSCFGISESVLISALNDDNLIWTKPCEYELTGEVIQINNYILNTYYQDECGLVIRLDIGYVINPEWLPDGFTLFEGQIVELTYRSTYEYPTSGCYEVESVEIICIREAGGNPNTMDRIECPPNNTTSICAPVSKPASMTMEDFSTSSDPNYMNTMSMQMDEQTDVQPYFTTTTRTYTISDGNGIQKTCETKYHIANQFLKMPEVAKPGTICEEDLWSYIKIGTDQYKIYADHNGSKGEMMSTCNTPSLICSTVDFGVDTKVPNQYNLWATTYFEFPDGTVCESEAMPFSVDVQAKPTAALSTQNKTMSLGEGISLMDIVSNNKSGYWAGENIIYLMTATGENIAYFSANEAGVYKLYYTVRNDNCERSYLLVVEVASAGKAAATQASYKTMDTTFNMYPNPTTNQVFIDLPDEAVYQINLMDISGKIVKETKTKLDATTVEINLNDLHKGMYLVELKNEDSQNIQKLIIE